MVDSSAINSSPEDVETITKNIQTHLNEIQKQRYKWKISLNPQKSTVGLFTRRRSKTHCNYKMYGNNILWSSNIKYLGVVLVRKLTWNAHYTIELQRGCKRLKILCPLINRQTSQN